MTKLTKFWFLENFNFMRKIGMMNMMKIGNLLEMEHIKKGDELDFNRDDKNVVFFLKAGTIKIVSKENNHTHQLVKRGNIFGELVLFDDDLGESSDKAVVLEDGIVCFIEADMMKDLMEKHTSLKNDLLKINGFKIKRLQRRLEDLLYKNSETRIREFLFSFVKDFGEENEGVLEAKNMLSHSDIAHLTNTSRQTVNNVMSNLRKAGVIDYNTKVIQLKKEASKLEGK